MHWKLFPSVPGRLSHMSLYGYSFNTSVNRVYEVLIHSYLCCIVIVDVLWLIV